MKPVGLSARLRAGSGSFIFSCFPVLNLPSLMRRQHVEYVQLTDVRDYWRCSRQKTKKKLRMR